jgi:hypothetical protein
MHCRRTPFDAADQTETIAPDIVVMQLNGRVSMGRPCQKIEALTMD